MFSQNYSQSFSFQQNSQNLPFSQQNTSKNCDYKQLNRSYHSTESMESTQGSDNNSQGSGENSQHFNKKSTKKDMILITKLPLEKEKNQIQMVDEYATEIFYYLRSIEGKFMPDPYYMHNVQKDVTESMRAKLLDWLVDVHVKFELLPETLFMTANIIDRFLSKIAISREILQLVGVTALFIASKYEEVYPPEVAEFANITKNTFSVKEILQMEGQILSSLEFDLTFSSSNRFLERYSQLCNLNQKSLDISKYLIELAFLEYKMLKYPSSLLACSALFLTMKINKNYPEWPEIMAINSCYLQKDLKNCATDLFGIWKKADKISFSALRRKFANPKYSEVSLLFWQ